MDDRDAPPKVGVFLAIAGFPLLVAGYRAVIDATPDLRVVGALDSRETLHEQLAGSAADIVVTEWLPSTTASGPSFPTIDEVRAASPSARILNPGDDFFQNLTAAAHEARATGNLAFDAQIVAVCREHGVGTILSEDRDFQRFTRFQVVGLDDPEGQ
jgi:predicted nucleic acid-binding protein